MIRARLLALLATLSIGACGAAAPVMTWNDLYGRPRPQPGADARIAYGADPLQHVDLWLPRGAGPFPVVLMVHGGCWQTDVAKADIMDWAAADLRARGIAVWNIEYRGADRPGGGYPGTFLDAAAASDALRGSAAKYHLRTDRIVAVGHSAGGHLILWLAARRSLPRTSPLWRADPLPFHAAISLGGLPDLAAADAQARQACGVIVPRLVGPATRAHPDVYADTSPARLPAPTIPVTLLNAALDKVAPPAYATAYAARMGGTAKRVTIANEAHVELIAPGSKAWAETVRLIEAALH